MAEAMTEGLTAHLALRSANRAGIANLADVRCAPLRREAHFFTLHAWTKRARRRIGKFCDGFSSAWDG